jgi:crotonobetainyl-CoA:carnitine CoA-transferase CaiB-like acyl-CoA transferase
VSGAQPLASLAGVRILDLTRNLAGPYCTLTLAELGADVVKIESPAGDDTRYWAPRTGERSSAIFASANRSKRSVCVDLDHPEGVGIIRKLAGRSDVLVESFRPGALDRRGLGWDDLRPLNDRLVYCSISAFGRTGPRAGDPGYDPVIQAATGIMSITGEESGRPSRLGVGAVDLGAGMWATIGILVALRSREQTGRGCRVDTSLFEAAGWWLTYHVAMYAATGAAPRRHGSASPAIAPYECFRTADGELFVAAGNDAAFARLCEALGLAELPGDPRFAENADRVANNHELHRILEERFSRDDAATWERRLSERSVPCSPVRTVADFAADAQTAALRLLPDGVPDAGVALPVTFDEQRPAPHREPPALGAEGREVLEELGLDGAEIEALRRDGAIR